MTPTDNHTPVTVFHAERPSDRAAWVAAWERHGRGELFYHPAYLEQAAFDGERARCAYFCGPGGGHIFYAFLQRPITRDAAGDPVAGDLTDIYTALPYGGPLGAAATEEDIAKFWDGFDTWAHTAGIVSEFIRFTPVADMRLAYPGELTVQAPHVVRELAGLSIDEVLTDVRRSRRQGERKAIALGLTIEVDETGAGIEDFLDIYYETMARADAADQFYHPPELFYRIHEEFPGRFVYLHVRDGETRVSTELILLSDRVAYAFLGGTRTSALTKSANVFLQMEVIRYLKDRGTERYIIGGGINNTGDDALLSFKRSFAPHGTEEYMTGRRIFDPVAYARLTAPLTDEDRTVDYFPMYRLSSRLVSTPLATAGGGRRG